MATAVACRCRRRGRRRRRRRQLRGDDAGGSVSGIFVGADLVRPPVLPIALMTQEEWVFVPTWFPVHRLLLLPRRLTFGPPCSHMAGVFPCLVTRRQPKGERLRGAGETMARLGEVPSANAIARCIRASACTLLTVAAASAALFGSLRRLDVARTLCAPSGHAASTPLSAPKTSLSQDEKFFTDVTEADPALVTYEQQQEDVALRGLLTDGSAFCALLHRAGGRGAGRAGIDQALVAEADGARSTESTTHLPLSVTTFNTIEAVALVDALCFGTEAAAGPRQVQDSRARQRAGASLGLTSARCRQTPRSCRSAVRGSVTEK